MLIINTLQNLEKMVKIFVFIYIFQNEFFRNHAILNQNGKPHKKLGPQYKSIIAQNETDFTALKDAPLTQSYSP